MIQQATQQTDYTPARLRKLMLRLANLTPGMGYTVTLILNEEGDPAYVIAPLGKLENGYRQERGNVLR